MEWRIIMNKCKIIALCGPAGSGKDYILSNLFQTPYAKMNFNKIVPSTTRPARPYQADGIHYYFINTTSEFMNAENLKKWIEFSCFNNWWYGTSIDALREDKINVGIFSPNSIKQLLENDKIDCTPVLIWCPDKIRLLRQLNREGNPNCNEICRRFLADKKDFLNLPFSYKVIENVTNEIQPVVSDLIKIIRQGQN